MYEMKQSGWIELICGSMFSGKSEELIKRVNRAQFAKQNISIFKPSLDNRYAKEAVVSHNGRSVMAKPIERSTEIFNYIDHSIDMIAIDEVQFFDEEIITVSQQLANSGYRVSFSWIGSGFSWRTIWTNACFTIIS